MCGCAWSGIRLGKEEAEERGTGNDGPSGDLVWRQSAPQERDTPLCSERRSIEAQPRARRVLKNESEPCRANLQNIATEAYIPATPLTPRSAAVRHAARASWICGARRWLCGRPCATARASTIWRRARTSSHRRVYSANSSTGCEGRPSPPCALPPLATFRLSPFQHCRQPTLQTEPDFRTRSCASHHCILARIASCADFIGVWCGAAADMTRLVSHCLTDILLTMIDGNLTRTPFRLLERRPPC